MASTLPTFTPNPPEVYDTEADAALVQNGVYKKPSFFGDNSLSSGFSSFLGGVNTALSYAGNIARKFETVDERDDKTGYRLTKSEYALLQKRASSISSYSKIPYDTCEDFLIILCFIDKINDMRKIADAVQIPELDDETIMLKPEMILNIPRLEKICFAASALDALINMFRKYINTAQMIDNNDKSGESISSIISSI